MKKFIENKNFLNFSEMGTGKTLMCIGAMNWLQAHEGLNKVLILCPKSLIYNWKKEFEKSKIKWNAITLRGTNDKKKKEISKASKSGLSVIIGNYESIGGLLEEIKSFTPQLIICDEAHQLKNHQAKRTKAVKEINTHRRWALTGTPIINKPLDIWSLVNWVAPHLVSRSFYGFRARYAIVYTGGGFPAIKGYKNLKELKEKVDQVSWKVTKAEALDLPEKVYQVREIKLSKEEALAYNQMSKTMVADIKGKEVAANIILTKLLRLMQIVNGFVNDQGVTETFGRSKLDALMEIVNELEDKKIVIWTTFRHDFERVETEIRSVGRSVYVLKADLTPDERQEQIDKFQSDAGSAVMVGSIAIGGVGVTLTAASYCVYYSNTWSLGDRLQSEDRLHRIGQTNKVTYIDLVASNSIDEYIIKTIGKKQSLANVINENNLKDIIFGGNDGTDE